MNKVIYIEADEEITNVISRIKKVKEPKIYLVIPKDSIILGSIVNLKILKKHEKDFKKEIIIVTTDRIGRHIASQVGFPVIHSLDESKTEDKEESKSVSSGPKIEFRSPKEEEKELLKKETSKDNLEITFKKIKDETFGVAPDLEREKTQRSFPEKKKISGNTKRLLFGFGIFGFISAILAIIFILPKALIIISPRAEEMHEEVPLEVKIKSQEGDFLKGDLLEITKESFKDYPATGKKNIGDKAKGTITVYNEWDSNPQPLVKGTRFLSTDGKLFRTTYDIVVPGTTVQAGNIVPGTVNVNVEAQEPGEAYNIGPSKFTIPGLPLDKQVKIYGKSTSPMAGGLTKEIKVVSKEDIENAKDDLTEKMVAEVKEEFSKKAGGEKVLEAAIKEEILEEKISPNEGEEAQQFTLTFRKNFWTISFEEEKAKEKIFIKLKDNLPEDKEIVEGKLENIEYKIIDIDKNNGLSLNVSVIGYAVNKLDLEKTKGDLLGKNKEEVTQYFKQKEEIVDVDVKFWPFWVKKVPSNRSRIEIKINISGKK